MDNKKGRVYIVKTMYTAGIFLSRKCIDRKVTGRYNYEIFDSFKAAYDAFSQLYKDTVDMSAFRVNHLYEVHPRNVFCAFYCRDFYGITYTDQYYEFRDRYFPDTDRKVYCKPGFTESEARAHLRSVIARRYLKTTVSANIYIRPHQIYLVSEIK